jgi:hypothetical protein
MVLKLGVPADLVDLLIALHKVVDVHFEVDGVIHVLESPSSGSSRAISWGLPSSTSSHLRGDDGVEASAGSGGAV